MTIDLYYTKLISQCRAVMMALKQLKLEANIKTIDLRNGDHLKPEYLKVRHFYILYEKS